MILDAKWRVSLVESSDAGKYSFEIPVGWFCIVPAHFPEKVHCYTRSSGVWTASASGEEEFRIEVSEPTLREVLEEFLQQQG